MNSNIATISSKAAAGALCALLALSQFASAAKQAATPRLPVSRIAGAAAVTPRLPALSDAPQARVPEAVLKAMGYNSNTLAAEQPREAAAQEARIASPEKLAEVADVFAAAPQNMREASADDAQGSGRKLEQAMTGERSIETTEGAAEPTLPQASAWGKGVADKMLAEFGKAIIGQKRAIQSTLIALITARSIDLVALPGTGKTEMAKVLAKITGMDYKRVQFTADLMPSDITGGFVRKYDEQKKEDAWVYEPGPVFTQIFHADELNRAQPKTQGALLEAMQEKGVTAGGVTRPLDENFFLIATRNPIEQDGTYPIPEAALDRFIGSEVIEEGDEQETLDIVKLNATRGARPQIDQVTSVAEIEGLRSLAEALPMKESVRLYAVRLARATVDNPVLSKRVRPVVSPRRAAISLEVAARALAVLRGHAYVSNQEITDVAHMVLRHRIAMNSPADDKEAFIWEILDSVQTPSERDLADLEGQARLAKPAPAGRKPMRSGPAVSREPILTPPVHKSLWKPWTWFK